MFCSQIHGMRPSLKDPLTLATVTWLEAVISNPVEMTSAHWITLKAFGKLRQVAAVQLLTPTHGSYLGFSSLASPHNLGDFIDAQDGIVWQQQVTQEISKIPGGNSAKTSTILCQFWSLMRRPDFVADVRGCETYFDMVQMWEEVPGNGPYSAKNCVE